MTLSKFFSNSWKFVAGGATILGYEAWYRRLQNPPQNQELKEQITTEIADVKQQIINLQNQLSANYEENKSKALSRLDKLTNSINNMRQVHSDWFKKFEGGADSFESPSSIYLQYKSEIDASFKKVYDNRDSLVNFLNDKFSKLIEDNSIYSLINDFQSYISSLSVMELCLIINITSCLFILTCIISIIFAISGNYLIAKLSLDKKLPKLSKIIQWRVKFQNYYILINIIFIILALLPLIFINTITLING